MGVAMATGTLFSTRFKRILGVTFHQFCKIVNNRYLPQTVCVRTYVYCVLFAKLVYMWLPCQQGVV